MKSAAAFTFRTRSCSRMAAGVLRLSYGVRVLEAPFMLNCSILIPGAFIGLLVVGLVALADGVVRQQLQQAAGEMASMPATEVAQTIGATR